MNRRTSRKYASLHLKQGLLSFLLLVFTIYLGAASSLKQTLFPPTVNNISSLMSDSYSAKNPYIQLHCDKLYYTGYDNQSDSSITGHYYYALQGGYCIFILLEATGSKPAKMIKNYNETVRIAPDKELYKHLISIMATDMDWSSESLKNICIPLIASQPDYHPVTAILFVVILIFCFFIFSLSVIHNFYRYYKCRF